MKYVSGILVGLLLFMGIALLFGHESMGIGAKDTQAIKLYQQGTRLYTSLDGVEEVLLDKVIDYELTSLDGREQCLMILHEERSEDIDQENYEMATDEGLTVGGYVRFYTIVIEEDAMALKLIYEKDFTRVNPWSIVSGHLDDNGLLDVYIGAYRATDYYEAARRPFVLEWTGRYLTRKWTGSALNTMTFSKVTFEDMDGDGLEELVAYQDDAQLGPVKNYFKWGNFAFDQVETEVIESLQ